MHEILATESIFKNTWQVHQSKDDDVRHERQAL
jgi:hypothetical protein